MRKREVFLDYLRVAATCAVVLLHTVMGVMGTTDLSAYPLERKVFLAAMDLICWCVPVFLMISGYLFLNPERELSFKTMLTRYCRRILLALFVFGVPYACLELMAVEKTFRPGMLLQGVVMVLRGQSWSHMWYLYLILLLYLLTPAMRWLLVRTPRAVVYALLGVLAVGSSLLPFLGKLTGRTLSVTLAEDSIYFFYYICGYLFATSKKTAGARFLPWAAAALMLAMAASRLFGGYTLQMAYNYPFTLILALLIFSAGKGREAEWQKKNTGCITALSGLSFGVYLIHPVFLNVCYKFLGITPLSFCIWVSLPAFFAGTLLLSVLGSELLGRIPPLKRYVL